MPIHILILKCPGDIPEERASRAVAELWVRKDKLGSWWLKWYVKPQVWSVIN